LSNQGYGLIYVAASTDPNITNFSSCNSLTVLVSFEAFIGLLFASMCGAIIFIKVARVQSFAQVIFSDPVCIRYGTGVRAENDDDGNDSGDGSDEGDGDIPCPVLEFRVANRMHSVAGGEIIDATIHVVASIDASQACKTLRESTMGRRRGKKGKKGGRRSRGMIRRQDPSTRSMPASSSGFFTRTPGKPAEIHPLSRNRPNSSHFVHESSVNEERPGDLRRTQSFDEDPTGRLVPKTILSKLDCETQDHPFFKRVWTLRHTLDHHSPLLKSAARAGVKQNRGFWPPELNTAEGVRNSIQFEQLLVSMSGTSNADANSVYAHRVYDFVDVTVGYQFVNMLYRDVQDGSLCVDTSLINDVMEQAGGGGEAFSHVQDGTRADDIMVL
jgi:hypothetical protein